MFLNPEVVVQWWLYTECTGIGVGEDCASGVLGGEASIRSTFWK